MLDIIERLENDEMFVDAVDDAIAEILKLRQRRIVALMDGGDWTDASVEHLVVPDNMDIKRENTAYRSWYQDVFCQGGGGVKFATFSNWLKQRGARDTTDDEVFEFWDV